MLCTTTHVQSRLPALVLPYLTDRLWCQAKGGIILIPLGLEV